MKTSTKGGLSFVKSRLNLTSLIVQRSVKKIRLTDSSWDPVVGEGQCFLRVFDLPNDEASPTLVGKTNLESTLTDVLLSLPDHRAKCARVFFVEGAEETVATLQKYIDGREYSDDLAETLEYERPSSMSAIRDDMDSPNSMTTYYYQPEEPKNGVSVEDDFGRLDGYSSFLTSLKQFSTCMWVTEASSDRVIVVVSCQTSKLTMSVKGVTKVVQSTEPNSWRLKDLKHEHTVDNYWQSTIDQLEAFTQTFFHQDAIRSLTLRNASSASVSAFSPSSPLPSPHRASWQPPSFPSPISTRKSLFQLCYYTTLLTHTSHFLARISKTYVQKRSALFDPRKLVLFPSLIHEITRDALLYEEFKNITVDIVDAVRERLDLLSHTTTISTTTATGGGGGPPPEFKIMASKLTWSCSHAQKTAFRFVDTLNQLLKLLEVSRTVDESIRLRILSILASVFLPLSVAGSLLSMQTRLRDVGVLLWDFVGVTLLLASFLFVLFLVIRVYLVLQERLETWQGHGEAHLVVKATLTYGMRPALVTIWAITMIAFLLGMFEGESIGLGAQVLGYGVLLPSAVAILVGIFIWGVISGKQTMKDKEKGQGKQGRSWTFISLTDFRRRRQSKYTKADAA